MFMSYNVHNFPKFVNTAGKITVLTAVAGLAVFVLAFLFNAGTNELMRADATSTASTTLTVLNTPPLWTIYAYEETESSTSTPTNSGRQIAWVGTAADSNSQPYFLIVCSGSATPTAQAASGYGNLGSAPPRCNPTSTLWAVSASTTSGAQARAATTTTESAPFTELNDWYAWVCDDDPVNPRCNNAYSTGTSATNSSPFHVNFRPVFTNFYNDSPSNPGALLTFYSTSSDPDSVAGQDNIVLHVCNENDFNTTTAQCGPGGTIATTTGAMTDNATALYTLPPVIQDQVYDAFGFLVDQHGHSASGGSQGSNPGFTVNNVAPTVGNGSIIINGGADIQLTNPAGQTTGFTLAATVSDANSCLNAASSSEVTNLVVSVFRTNIGSSTCNGTAGSYNPNQCYPNGIATTTWNLSCTASSTSCTGASDPTVEWNCTYPLWFLADPTDVTSPFATTTWSAAVAGIDDDNATGTLTVGTSTVELYTFPALNLLTAEIPYGALEPGTNSPTLSASTTVVAVGNAGIDQDLEGESMCTNFSIGTPCPSSSTSTVAENNQRFGTSTVSYASGIALSSSTVYQLELNVPKTTSTSTYASGVTYWGIAVPGSITLAGSYTGLNTFMVAVSEPSQW
jgi:hypothetical protein